jgi:AraC-like DNA-binding protein
VGASVPGRAEPTLGGTWVRLLLDALGQVGFDAAAHCERRGWDPAGLDDGRRRLPWSEVVALWREALRDRRDPALGVHAASRLPFGVRGPFGYLIMSSPTLRDALLSMIRYEALHFDGRALALDERGDHAAIVLSLPADPPPLLHQVEYACVLLHRTCAWAAGPAFHLREVRFRHASPAGPALHERVFGCPVHFRHGENALLLERRMLALPSLYANPAVLATAQALADRQIAEQAGAPWVRRVKRALEARPTASVAQVAHQLAVSPRSLQRRLAGEGARFEHLLDGVRRERALALVGRGDLRLAAVAREAGFTDPRAFARAFRRWTGLRPSAYRARSGTHAGRPAGSEEPAP